MPKVATILITEVDGLEFEWLLTGYFSKYVPAKIVGPWENCHPEEPSVLEEATIELRSITPNNIAVLPSAIEDAKPADEWVETALYEALDNCSEDDATENPVCFLVHKIGTDIFEQASEGEKSTNPEFWTDAFPVYAELPKREPVLLSDAKKIDCYEKAMLQTLRQQDKHGMLKVLNHFERAVLKANGIGTDND